METTISSSRGPWPPAISIPSSYLHTSGCPVYRDPVSFCLSLHTTTYYVLLCRHTCCSMLPTVRIASCAPPYCYGLTTSVYWDVWICPISRYPDPQMSRSRDVQMMRCPISSYPDPEMSHLEVSRCSDVLNTPI
jgi:hypothetical protein